MIAKAIVDILLSSGVVTGLVATRVYPPGGVPVKATRPYVHYQIESTDRLDDLKGARGKTLTGAALNIVAETYEETQVFQAEMPALWEAIRDSVYSGVTVEIAEVDSQGDLPNGPADHDSRASFESTTAVTILHR